MKIRQIEGRIYIGRIKTTISRTSIYFGYMNFGMIFLTFYSITGYKYAPLWLFLCGMAITLSVIGAIDYFIVLPSEQAFSNQQVARHQSPIFETVKEIQEELKK